MRMVFAGLAVALLTASCSSTSAINIQDSKPMEDEFHEVARFTERKIPGVEYYVKAWIAYMDYKSIVDEQEEQMSPVGRRDRSYIPEEYYEEKKSKYLARAEEHLKKVLEVNQDFGEAHQMMGAIHLLRGKYEQAMAEFKEVLRINPVDEIARMNIARTYWRQGDAKKAKEAIAEVLETNPQNQHALLLRDAIEHREQTEAAKKALEGVPPFRPRVERWDSDK
jgi:tetratricopeptide (TPR) repeat protein